MKGDKILSVILAAALTVSMLLGMAFPVSALGVGFPSVSFSPNTEGDSIKGRFNYFDSVAHSGGVYDFVGEADYYYTDSYFTVPSAEYNSHLATMSFSLCMSAFNNFGASPDTSYENAEKLLSDIGFTAVESNAETDNPPTPDTIGVIMAKKTIIDDGKPYTLVSLTLRSSGYGSEWASNFLVGDESCRDGNHKGFYDSRDRALEFAKDYITRNAAGDVKLWITGFSRGGAVSGLIGAWFDDNIDSAAEFGITLLHENIFTYTFEAPATTHKQNLIGKNYTNIFNVLNKADLVPKVPFTGNSKNGWSFENPGIKMPFSDIGTEEASALNEIIKSITPYSVYDIHNFASIIGALGKTQDKFLDNFLSNIASRIDRQTYVEKIETPLCEIVGNITNHSNEEARAIAKDLINGISVDIGIKKDMGVTEVVQFVGSLMANDESANSVIAAIGNNLVRVGALSEYNESVRTALSTLVNAIAKNDENGTNLLLYVANIAMNTTSLPFDEENNISNNRIIEAHLPDIILGMLMFEDSNFKDSPSGYLSSVTNREILEVSVVIDGVTYTHAYYKGDVATLHVTVPKCATRGAWLLDGAELSNDEYCSLTVTESVKLTVHTSENHIGITDWIIEKEPTAESNGRKYMICTECGTHIAEAEIPRLAEADDIPEPPKQDFPIAMVTGGIIAGIFVLSLVGIFLLRGKKPKASADDNIEK